MKREIAVESTTLPEGAIISVARVKTLTRSKSGKDEDIKESPPHSEVSASHDDTKIVMNVAQMSPLALRPYLDLTIRELEKQRERLKNGALKPHRYDPPRDFSEFAATMAHHEMFILR